MQYPSEIRIIRTMCSGRIAERFILHAFARGIAAVLISGCHPGNCHYINANYQTEKRVKRLWKKMEELGIDPARLQLGWFSAAEGEKFAEKAREMAEIVHSVTSDEIDMTIECLKDDIKIIEKPPVTRASTLFEEVQDVGEVEEIKEVPRRKIKGTDVKEPPVEIPEYLLLEGEIPPSTKEPQLQDLLEELHSIMEVSPPTIIDTPVKEHLTDEILVSFSDEPSLSADVGIETSPKTLHEEGAPLLLTTPHELSLKAEMESPLLEIAPISEVTIEIPPDELLPVEDLPPMDLPVVEGAAPLPLPLEMESITVEEIPPAVVEEVLSGAISDLNDKELKPLFITSVSYYQPPGIPTRPPVKGKRWGAVLPLKPSVIP